MHKRTYVKKGNQRDVSRGRTHLCGHNIYWRLGYVCAAVFEAQSDLQIAITCVISPPSQLEVEAHDWQVPHFHLCRCVWVCACVSVWERERERERERVLVFVCLLLSVFLCSVLVGNSCICDTAHYCYICKAI